jgi:hypothetical protein
MEKNKIKTLFIACFLFNKRDSKTTKKTFTHVKPQERKKKEKTGHRMQGRGKETS